MNLTKHLKGKNGPSVTVAMKHKDTEVFALNRIATCLEWYMLQFARANGLRFHPYGTLVEAEISRIMGDDSPELFHNTDEKMKEYEQERQRNIEAYGSPHGPDDGSADRHNLNSPGQAPRSNQTKA